MFPLGTDPSERLTSQHSSTFLANSCAVRRKVPKLGADDIFPGPGELASQESRTPSNDEDLALMLQAKVRDQDFEDDGRPADSVYL